VNYNIKTKFTLLQLNIFYICDLLPIVAILLTFEPYLFTMNLTDNIKKIREQKGMLQKDIYTFLKIGKSVYSKIESGGREPSVQELVLIAQLFEMSIDDIVHFNNGVPKPVTLQNKTDNEQNKLFEELDEDDKQTVFKIVDKMLTTKKFNTFFQEHLEKK
jgi:transcriptional regulator with XRE-family HTH domain